MTSKQGNYIIIGQCFVVLLMVVGYTAFSSQLNITGTAVITSKWNILITNVTSKETNWIFYIAQTATNKYLWLVFPYASSSSGVFYVYSTGLVHAADAHPTDSSSAPICYLSSDININGTGTEEASYEVVTNN